MSEQGTVAAFREAMMLLSEDVINIAGESMKEQEQPIVRLMVEQQYTEGISGNESPLRPYSTSYRKQKEKRGVYQGHTDFSLSGKMQSEMALTIDGSQYSIDSPVTASNGDRISSFLKKRDVQSFEFTPENKENVWRIIAPTFNEKVGSRFD